MSHNFQLIKYEKGNFIVNSFKIINVKDWQILLLVEQSEADSMDSSQDNFKFQNQLILLS